MNFVLDASVAVAWCLDDESGRYADQVYKSFKSATALVSCIWPLEVSNAVQVAQRRNRVARVKILEMLGILERLPITVAGAPTSRELRRLYSLAEEHAVSVYDASYLDLCLKLGLPLATLDARLKEGGRTAGVELYKP